MNIYRSMFGKFGRSTAFTVINYVGATGGWYVAVMAV
jgi:hypothetical protein